MTPEHLFVAGIGIALAMVTHLVAVTWRAHRTRIRITKPEESQ